jgi:hypothetical protein
MVARVTRDEPEPLVCSLAPTAPKWMVRGIYSPQHPKLAIGGESVVFAVVPELPMTPYQLAVTHFSMSIGNSSGHRRRSTREICDHRRRSYYFYD